MGTAGRGPKIKVQAPEERPKSHARPTPSPLVASTSFVVSDVLPVGVRRIRAGDQRLPDLFTEGEPEETTGAARWIGRGVALLAAAAGMAVLIAAVMGWL